MYMHMCMWICNAQVHCRCICTCARALASPAPVRGPRAGRPPGPWGQEPIKQAGAKAKKTIKICRGRPRHVLKASLYTPGAKATPATKGDANQLILGVAGIRGKAKPRRRHFVPKIQILAVAATGRCSFLKAPKRPLLAAAR